MKLFQLIVANYTLIIYVKMNISFTTIFMVLFATFFSFMCNLIVAVFQIVFDYL